MWNYRIIYHDVPEPEQEGWEPWYGLHEVFYDNERPHSWTQDAVEFQCGHEEGCAGVIGSLHMALNDVSKRTVLIESELLAANASRTD